MDFTLTEAQLRWQAKAKKFAEQIIAPQIHQLENDRTAWQEAFQKLANEDFLTFAVPEDEDAGVIAYLLVIKEIAKVDAGIAAGMALTTQVADAVWRFGTVSQQERYLPRIASGESIPGAFAMTEKESGSDFVNIATFAALDPEDSNYYIINGEKGYVINGDNAGIYLVVARTAPILADGGKGISVFLVERGTPGLTVQRKIPKLGILTANLAHVSFNQCRVPRDQLLGKEGEGLKIILNLLDNGRLVVAAQSLGIAEAAYEAALNHAKQRRTFGVPLFDRQAIAFKLAEMHVKLEAAELLMMKAGWKRMQGMPFTVQASTAKLFCSEAANWIANEALQIFGGYGYTKETPIEKYFRDARITTLYEGTSEIQQIIIARHL